jgi:hypothetical protein
MQPYGWKFEQLGRRHLPAQRIHHRRNLYAHYRVAAQLEEIVVDADPVYVHEVLPYRDELFLQGRCGLDVTAVECPAGVRRGGQRSAIQFSVCR